MSTTGVFSFNLPAIGGDDDSWGTVLNGNWTTLDEILAGNGAAIVINGTTQNALTLTAIASADFAGKIKEKVFTAGSSGTVNINPADGTIQTISMTGDVTITESMADGEYVTLRITSVGADSITWPAMEWMFGVEPTLDATRTNWVHLWQVGGVLYGNYLGFSS